MGMMMEITGRDVIGMMTGTEGGKKRESACNGYTDHAPHWKGDMNVQYREPKQETKLLGSPGGREGIY